MYKRSGPIKKTASSGSPFVIDTVAAGTSGIIGTSCSILITGISSSILSEHIQIGFWPVLDGYFENENVYPFGPVVVRDSSNNVSSTSFAFDA